MPKTYFKRRKKILGWTSKERKKKKKKLFINKKNDDTWLHQWAYQLINQDENQHPKKDFRVA